LRRRTREQRPATPTYLVRVESGVRPDDLFALYWTLYRLQLSPVWTGREPIPCARKSFIHNLIGIIKDDEERSSS
jgi:hypothetical protein